MLGEVCLQSEVMLREMEMVLSVARSRLLQVPRAQRSRGRAGHTAIVYFQGWVGGH